MPTNNQPCWLSIRTQPAHTHTHTCTLHTRIFFPGVQGCKTSACFRCKGRNWCDTHTRTVSSTARVLSCCSSSSLRQSYQPTAGSPFGNILISSRSFNLWRPDRRRHQSPLPSRCRPPDRMKHNRRARSAFAEAEAGEVANIQVNNELVNS